MEHHQHGDEMHHNPEPVRHRRNVICERDCCNQSRSRNEPDIRKSEACSIKPQGEEEDDAATTQGNRLVRTSQVRLIDDVQSVRNPEIKQLHAEKQEGDYDILNHYSVKDLKVCLIPSSEVTGKESIPIAVLILALLTT